jgi:hypothetical protein
MIRTHRGGIWTWADRRRIERLLGAALPQSAQELRYLDWQPSGDLAYHEALIRFRVPLDEYRSWMSALGLANGVQGGVPADGPAIWQAPPEIDPPSWWDASADFTPDAAWGQIGPYGALAMKWERGAVYVHIVDTGHAVTEHAPAPDRAR